MTYSLLAVPVLGPMTAVLDACAMIAYLTGEEGGNVVYSLLSNPANTVHTHAINLLEVYYHFRRDSGELQAESAINDLLYDGVKVHHDIDTVFWKSVGAIKAEESIALGDCFALALAQRINGEIITSDRNEFEPLDSKGYCPIHFIRERS